MGFFFEKIAVVDNYGVRSEIELKNGLNIICGPSNTGKTYILRAIDYILNSSKFIDDEEDRNYEYVEAEISYSGSRVTVRRYLKTHKTALINENGSEKRISADKIKQMYLSMSGICTEKVEIYRNQDREVQALTLRTLKTVMMIDEENVVTVDPIITHATSGDGYAQTACLSAFLYLLYKIDRNVIEDEENEKEKKARRRIIRNYVENKLQLYNERIRELDEKLLIGNEDNVEQEITQLAEAVSILEQKSRSIHDYLNPLLQEKAELEKNIAKMDVEMDRYAILRSQYEADIRRLDFFSQGNSVSEKVHTVTECPFCHGPMHDKEECDYAGAAETEKEQTLLLKQDLDVAIAALNQNLTYSKNRLSEIDGEMKEYQRELSEVIIPELSDSRDRMDAFLTRQRSLAERESLEKIVASLSEEINTEEFTNPETVRFSAKKYFKPEFFEGLDAELNNILAQIRFPNFVNAHFDREKFDVAIGDKGKRRYGKGYRALLNTVVELAFRKYMLSNSEGFPGFIVIDSPILSLKEAVTDRPEKTMRAALFRYMVENQDSLGQVIIIENEIPEIDYTGSNIIRFTKDVNNGRYGFIIGKVDDN